MQHDPTDHRSREQLPPLFGFPSLDDEPSSPLRAALDSISWTSELVRDLADLVGGIAALEQLDAVPLPDEPFDWTTIAEPHRERVAELLEALDLGLGATCPAPHADPGVVVTDFDVHLRAKVDVEYRCIARRLLARIATRDPNHLARTAPNRVAAALVWLALRGNDELKQRETLSAEELWKLFGVSNCADRGRAMHRAAGFDYIERSWQWSYRRNREVWLPDARFLHSRTRTALVQRRSDTIDAIERDVELRAARHPIQVTGGGHHYISARPITPRWALRSTTDNERSVVVLTLGEHTHHPEVLALSVPDARHLISMLENALDAPFKPRLV